MDALQAEVDALKRLQAESGQCPQPTLDALLLAIPEVALDDATRSASARSSLIDRNFLFQQGQNITVPRSKNKGKGSAFQWPGTCWFPTIMRLS